MEVSGSLTAAEASAHPGWERDRQIVLAHSQNMMLALRSNVKFGGKTRLVHAPHSREHSLTVAIQDLRDRLCDPRYSHIPVDGQAILKPFADVAASVETTEPITGVALAAFAAFAELKCDFLKTENLRLMAKCARESRSEVMDPQSHETIVARILQLYVACVRHPAGRHIDEPDVVEMLHSAFVVATQSPGSASDLLLRTAEQVMNDVVAAVYEGVAQYRPGAEDDAPFRSYPGVLKYLAGLIACETGSGARVAIPSVQLQGLTLAHTALFVLRDAVTEPRCKALMQVIANDLARALLRVGKHSDNVIVLAQMLRTMHLVVSFASPMVVPQLLSFLTSVHMAPPLPPTHEVVEIDRREREELIFESLFEFCSDPAFPAFVFHHMDLSPHFNPILDNLCSFLSRASGTPAGDTPSSGGLQDVVRPITQTNVLAVDCLLAMIKSLEVRVTKDAPMETPERVKHMLEKKSRLLKFSSMLLDSQKKAVRLLLRENEPNVPDFFDLGPKPGPRAIANFLAQHSTLLDKGGLADYLSDIGHGPPKPKETDLKATEEWMAARRAESEVIGSIGYHMKLLEEYLTHIPFRGLPLISGIRELVANMGMPRESQKIDRVMEAFAKEWFKQNTGAPAAINPFKGSDAAFILSFSIMMLNTDLNSGKLDKSMPVETFKSVNRGIDVDGASLPDEYLEAIYAEVKGRKIELIDVVDRGFDDDNAWQLEMQESMMVAAQHETEQMRLRHGDEKALAAYDSCVFGIIWRSCVTAFASMLDASAQNLTSGSAATVEAMINGLPAKDMEIVERALEGLRSCACTAHQLGDEDAVDHILSLLLKYLPMQLRDGFTSVQLFGRSPKALLVCRLAFNVTRCVAQTAKAAWREIGSSLAHMLLLGIFAEDDIGSPVAGNKSFSAPPTASASAATTVATSAAAYNRPASAGSGIVVPAALVTNPRIALPPSNNGSEGGGWFGGIFGGGSVSQAKRKERDLDDHHALLRVRNACPSLADVLDLSTRISEQSVVELLRGIASVTALSTPPASGNGRVSHSAAEGYTASILLHLMVEILILNADRIVLVATSFAEVVSVMLPVIAENADRAPHANAAPAEVAASAHWRGSWSRCSAALERLTMFVGSRQLEPRATLVLLSAIVHGLPPKATVDFSAGLCVALERLTRSSSTTGAELEPAEWDQLLRLLAAVGRDAALAEIRKRCSFAVLDVATSGRYFCPENVPALAEALTAFCVDGDNLPSDDGIWDRFNIGLDQIPLLSSPAVEPLPRPAFGDKQFQDLVGDAFLSLHNRLAAMLGAGRSSHSAAAAGADAASAPPSVAKFDANAWMAAWRRLLHCLAAVCFATTAKHPKLGGDALLLVQRCVLDPHLTALPPHKAHDLFDTVILPLVEKVCLTSPINGSSSAPPSQSASVHHSALATALSPSMLVTALFGPLAGPGQPQTARMSAAAHSATSPHFSDEIQSRTATMLPKCLLQYLPLLAAENRQFMPLFQRVLALLYALHTAPRSAETHSLLAEAVQESVRNLVLVLATMAQQPENVLLFAPYPNFWPSTRQLVKVFDFAGPLVEQLDAMGLTAVATDADDTR